jgi:hypothetical protein
MEVKTYKGRRLLSYFYNLGITPKRLLKFHGDPEILNSGLV